MKKYLLIALVVVSISTLSVLMYEPEAIGTNPDVIVLSDRTTVSLNLPITDESVKNLQVEFMEKSSKLKSSQPIFFVLNSPGGSIEAGQRLIETIKGLPQKVHTVSLFSASMSFIFSQYLDNRYVLENSKLMAHRATAGGIEGQVPGSLLSRTMDLLADVTRIEATVANRAKLPLSNYRELVRDELWMGGEAAVELKFADKVVRVRCDKSLQGPGASQIFDAFVFKLRVVFSKCPLITTPLSVELAERTEKSTSFARELFYDKPAFIRDYIETGRLFKEAK